MSVLFQQYYFSSIISAVLFQQYYFSSIISGYEYLKPKFLLIYYDVLNQI